MNMTEEQLACVADTMKKEANDQAAKQQMEKRSKFTNLTRYMNKCRNERVYADQIEAAEEEVLRKKMEIEEDRKLAHEMDKIKRAEVNEARLRQVLRETDPQLRELEAKLRAGYITKELCAQMHEKETARLLEKKRNIKEQEILGQVLIQEAELSKQRAQEEILEKAKYRQELQDQMIFKEKSKRYQYEEFLREKKMLDDIVHRIFEEEQREMEDKMCSMKKNRDEMNAFKVAQEIWKNKRRKELEEENIAIQKFLQDKMAREQQRKKEKADDRKRKEEISENIAKELYGIEQARREREEAIMELLEEEKKEAIEKRFRAEIEKAMKMRQETQQALDCQLEERKEKIRLEAEEDAKYKEQLLLKIANDEKVEQLTKEKKRLKLIQLRKEVEQMMIERRQKRAEELQMLNKLHEKEEEELGLKQKIIEEERRRLLKEHVQHLIGYIPKGLIKAEDLPHLGEDVACKYMEYYGK